MTVTGAGSEPDADADYANNTNAGTATASYTYAGDANHEASNDSEKFAIEKAPSTTVLTFEPAPTFIARAIYGDGGGNGRGWAESAGRSGLLW